MAEFTPSKKTAQDFNNGIEYVDGQGNETGDAVSAETINNLVESALYTQEQAEGAVSTASNAVDTANNALAVANGLDRQIKTANATANSANTTSQEAKSIAEEAKEIAEDAQKGVGTKVTVGGNFVATFDADTKSDKLTENKNLYNLGVYDTFVSNGDGTVTITRKTGYAYFDGSEDEEWRYQSTTPSNHRMYLENIVPGITKTQTNDNIKFVANTAEITAGESWGATNTGVGIENYNSGELFNVVYFAPQFNNFDDNDLNEFRKFLSENPIIIQYELENPYTETVIEYQPIHTLPQDGEVWLRDEWEKGLNLASVSYINLSFIKGQNRMQVIDAIPVDVGTNYCVQFSGRKSSSESWDLNGFGGWIALFWDSPYFSGSYSEAFLSSLYRYETEQVNITLSVTAEKPYLLIIMGNEGSHQLNINIRNLMLNKGSFPYPYKPYYGELTRNGVKRTGDTMTGDLYAPAFGQSDPNKDYVDFAGGTGKNFGISGENRGIYNLAHMLRKNDFYTSIKSSVSVSSNTSANINRVASVTATNNSPCLLTVFGVETAQHGALMISSNTSINSSWSNDNNNGSNILAKTEGEQGYWSKQYLCCSVLIPPNQTAYVYARYLEKIRYTLQPVFSL